MKRLPLAAAPLAALLTPVSGAACMMDPLPGAMMHGSLPNPLPAGAIVADAYGLSSCDIVFGDRRRGLIVAIPAGHRDGIAVAIPIFARRDLGFRLPDGYRLPPPSRRGDWTGN